MKKFYNRHFILDHGWMLLILLLFEIGFCISWSIQQISTILFLTILGGGILLSLLLILILCRLDYMSDIIEYCKNTGYSMEELEADFIKADKVGWRIRSGEQWIFYMDKESMPNIIRKDEIRSVEYNTESAGRGIARYTYCYMKNREIVKIPCSKKNYNKLEEIFGKRPKMIPTLCKGDLKRSTFLLIFLVLVVIASVGAVTTYYDLNENQFFIFSIVIIVPAVVIYVIYACRDTMKNVKNYCKEHKIRMESLETDFEDSLRIGTKIWCGKEWIYYIKDHSQPDVISKRDITNIKYPTGKKKAKIGFYHNDRLIAVISTKQEDAEQLKKVLEFNH